MELSISTLSHLVVIMGVLLVLHIGISIYAYTQLRNRRGPPGPPGPMGRRGPAAPQ